MFKTLISIVVSLSVSMGGMTATVAAAQDSLPGSMLYEIKTASEDVQLAMADEPRQFGLLMEFSQRRLEEMVALMRNDAEIPAPVMQRLADEIDNALQLAAQLGQEDQEAMITALEALQQMIQQQEQLMQQIQLHEPQNEEPLQIREMLQQRLRLIEQGLANPDAFRYHYGDENTPGPDEEKGGGSGNGAAGEENNGNGPQDGLGPNEEPGDGEPYGPQDGFGPFDPCPNEDSNCGQQDGGAGTGEGVGPGEGSGEAPGPGPDEDGTPAFNNGDNENGNNGIDNGGGEDNGGGDDNGGSDNGGDGGGGDNGGDGGGGNGGGK
jgi:hypothetical protein